MMRSLWTAASGMSSQNLKIDNISNNLSNVNTVGFKKERLEFQTLLYQTMQRANLDPANWSGRPVNLQVGHGVRPVAVSRMFTSGSHQRTDNLLDFAIDGEGFFMVQRAFGEYFFTRDGTFKLSPVDEGIMLVTSTGYAILGEDGDPIIIPDEVPWNEVVVDEQGRFWYADPELGTMEDLGIRILLVQFPNVQGLEAIGGNLFRETVASGFPLSEPDGEVNRPSRILQGVLEMSNVNIVEEMVNMIVAHRAYDLNSRVITTSDEMLQTANNLKRG